MAKRKSSEPTGAKSAGETKTDAILSKISGDFLECTICLEPFKDPKVLPCLHTFCEGCLKKFVAQDKVKNKFLCPTCRTETILPKGGVASFKNNFFVQSLSDTVQTHKSLVSKEDDKLQCDVCEEDGASQGCVPCEEFLCDECACAHRRAKRTRSHEVIGVAELKEQLITKTGSLKSKSLPICPKHEDEKMKFYCETCKHPICRDCTVLQHKNHKYGYLADAVVDAKAKIKNKLKAARQKITKYGGKECAVAKKQAELDTRSKKASEDIDAAAEEKIRRYSDLVRRKQTELKEKLESITADRSKQLSATADSVKSTVGSLSSTVDFSQKVVEHGSDFDVMNVYSDITGRLESLLNGPLPNIPDDISYVLFDPKQGKEQKRAILGSIVDRKMPKAELEEEEEESREEATFRFTVENFSKVTEACSPATFIRNLPWKIEAVRKEDPDSQPPNNKSLGVYLNCDVKSCSLWSCCATVELRLIPQKIGVKTVRKKFEHVFYSDERNWGFQEFMPWHEVCDPQKGYIKDDKIILEAYVKADAPCGEKELASDVDEDILEEEKKEEESQANASFRFTVDNVSKLSEVQLSPATFIRNLPWKIEAVSEEDPNSQPPNNKTLGVFLKCDVNSDNLWSCRASVELRLIPQKKGIKTVQKEFEHVFYSDEDNWGFQDFMPWHEVCDPKKGYIKDDKVILEAFVKAEAHRGLKKLIIGNFFSKEIPENEVEEEDESRADATIRFTVENFSKMENDQHSPVEFIRNLPWKIKAVPDHCSDSQLANKKSLAVYLQCDGNTNSFWSCRVSVKFRLIPQKGIKTHTMETEHVFYKNGGNWGFPKFLPWDDVCDPQKGYIKDDKIILEAHVKADAPHIFD
ncbi:uncharacterized protein LOC144866000 [Branchiostoma floridae x Branchiostoma japonicum]